MPVSVATVVSKGALHGLIYLSGNKDAKEKQYCIVPVSVETVVSKCAGLIYNLGPQGHHQEHKLPTVVLSCFQKCARMPRKTK